MEIVLISLLNGLVYGMLLFMLASGLTLIFSMMGVLNFAHAIDLHAGRLFRLSDQPVGRLLAGADHRARCCAALLGAAIEVWGLRRVHHNGHIAELLFTFGLVFIIGRVGADGLGHAADAISRAGLARFPAVHALRR